MKITVDAWKCAQCTHIWLATAPDPPEKCARCKSRKWNNDALGELRPADVRRIARKPDSLFVAPVQPAPLYNDTGDELGEPVIDYGDEFRQ